MTKILAFAGSLRKDSTNKKTVRIAARAAEAAGAEVTLIEIEEFPLPIYNGDDEAESGLPENAIKLQQMMLESDGFLIASPEYNSSISGALKNLIDWTSRPNGKQKAGACFAGKTASLMSSSPGDLGGLRGLFDVRKILSTMGVIVLPNQVTVARSYTAFDEVGNIIDEKMRGRIEKLGEGLVNFLDRLGNADR